VTDLNAKNFVQSAAKVFAVLGTFDAEAAELTISDVARRAQLDRGTAFRLVHTLRHLGYLAAVPDSSRFRLTLQCLEVGYGNRGKSVGIGFDQAGRVRPLT
jgi:IclR family pca regulon transcriptional regulator